MNLSLEDFVRNFPGIIYYKNINFEYIGGSQRFMRVTGLHSSKMIPGKTDFDLCWEVYADIYRHDDKLVLTGNQINSLETIRIIDGTDIIVCEISN